MPPLQTQKKGPMSLKCTCCIVFFCVGCEIVIHLNWLWNCDSFELAVKLDCEIVLKGNSLAMCCCIIIFPYQGFMILLRTLCSLSKEMTCRKWEMVRIFWIDFSALLLDCIENSLDIMLDCNKIALEIPPCLTFPQEEILQDFMLESSALFHHVCCLSWFYDHLQKLRLLVTCLVY